jgi:hypothetical protein
MSYNSSINASVVKTELDEVFMQEYEADPGPKVARASDSYVFMQSTSDSAAEIIEVFKGVGKWDQRAEEADVANDDPRVGDQQTFSMLNFAKSVDIPKNMFDDDQHSTIGMIVRDFAEMARVSQDDHAMSLWRDAFTGATFTTNDGVSLINSAHTTLNGDTVDNSLTATLSTSSFESAMTTLMTQVNQAGVVRGHQGHCLLVPPALFREAIQITGSEYEAGTANNEINVYKNEYGLVVKQSPYLSAAAGGSNTAWFLLARNHSVYRWVRQGVVTEMVDYMYQRNNSYIYKGEYREQVGAITYEGVVGSDGTV